VWRIVIMCLFFQTCVTQIMLPVIMSEDDSLVKHDRQAIMRKIWKEDIHFRPRYTLSCVYGMDIKGGNANRTCRNADSACAAPPRCCRPISPVPYPPIRFFCLVDKQLHKSLIGVYFLAPLFVVVESSKVILNPLSQNDNSSPPPPQS
jgi:hypothetical protein